MPRPVGLLLILVAWLGPRAASPAAVVEEVDAGSAAARAGLRPGDVLVSWREQAGLRRSGAVRTAFDAGLIDADLLVRGPVVFEGRRGAAPLQVVVAPDGVDTPSVVHLRPFLAARAGLLFDRARAAEARDAGDAAAALYRRAALAVPAPDEEGARCFLTSRAALADSDLERSRTDFGAAEECADSHPSDWLAEVVYRQAASMGDQHYDEAEDAVQVVLELIEDHRSAPLLGARLGRLRARLLLRRGRFEEATRIVLDVVARYREDAPGSPALADTLLLLSWLYGVRGLHAEALEATEEAAALAKVAGPESGVWARAMRGMGGGRLNQGSPEAERYFRLAYEWHRRFTPEHWQTVRALINVGVATDAIGDVAGARLWFRRALALADRIRSQVAPEMHAVIMANLARCSEQLGDTRAAVSLYRRALAEVEAALPTSYVIIELRSRLGVALAREGLSAPARAMLYSALDQADAYAPGSSSEAAALLNVGDQAWADGDPDTANEAYTRTAAILEKDAPLTDDLARALAGLARVALRRGQPEAAEENLRAAVALIEERRQGGGSGDARGLFLSRLYGVYQDLVELLAAQGRVRDAFAALELSRARTQLALLAERPLLSLDLPPDLETERRDLDAAYDRARTEAAGAEAAQRDEMMARLEDLRERQRELAGRIRERAPSLAAFRYPLPLGADAVAAALDPETLLVAYSVGSEHTVAISLSGGGHTALRAVTLPVGDRELRARVSAWRTRLEGETGATREAGVLFDLLLRPFAAELARARRLVLVPDGPLHALPFAALRDGGAFLAERKALSIAPSATLAVRGIRDRGPEAWEPPVLFGDPGPVPLPGSAAEVKAIAAHFPGSAVHLHADASEQEAKAVPARPRFVHFAVHALVDADSPLDSGLLLRGGRRGPDAPQNGLLQAWEIVEHVHLDTDLVTLSACRSAEGKERAGEGVVGLVRAFQYAGARSVLASLWYVDDHSAVTLMRRFYARLARGDDKGEALRAAQRAAIREGWPAARWATFQLYGAWK